MRPLHRAAPAMIAACLAMPPMIVAIALAGIEVYRFIEPDAPLFGGPAPASLVESITDGFGVEQTYQFIRMGQDPNAPVRIDDEEYAGGETIQVSPLMLAVAAADGSAVRMLLSFGARLDLPQNRRAECLARELGHREIQAILVAERGDGSAEPVCDGRRPDAPTPLAAWIGDHHSVHASDRR